MSLSQKFKREYKAWNMVKNACLDKENKKYRLYGGKGIEICKEWHDFQSFLKDMSEMPKDCDGMILKDKSKGYNKFNASWGKVKRGVQAQEKKKPIKTKKLIIKNSMSFCLTLDQDHYAFIKRQAIMRSQQVNEIVTANDLIREALIKAYPFSSQFDMFGDIKK